MYSNLEYSGRKCADMRDSIIRSILCITTFIALSSSSVYSEAPIWDEARATDAIVVALAAFSDADKLKNWTCRWCESGWLNKMTLVDPIWKNDAGIKGVVMHDGTTIYIAFGGSNSWQNWFINLNILRRKYPPDATSSVHSGFYNAMIGSRGEVQKAALKAMRLCPTCKKALFTGHSLGGAIAMLSALDLSKELKEKGIEISAITFGQPRVGNSDFANYVQRELPNLHRVVHKRDAIPHILMTWMGYAHPPNEIWEKSERHYIQCSYQNGEDPNCSSSSWIFNFKDHGRYMGFNVIW